MSFRILTDSASALTPADAAKYNVGVISFVFTVGGKDFLCFHPDKDTEAEAKRFYELLRIKADVKTSLINADKFLSAFDAVLAGGEDLLYIGIAGGISGTLQAARIAAEEVLKRYPERTCLVVDSLAASLGEGMMVMQAARLRDAGYSISQTVAEIDRLKYNFRQEFTIDSLYYLRKSGRVSALASIAGGMLGIKPLLHGSDAGTLEMHGKVRGRMNSLVALADSCAVHLASPDTLIGIAHADCLRDAETLRDMIAERTGAENFMIRYYDLCTGAHAGPGTLAVFYDSADGRKV